MTHEKGKVLTVEELETLPDGDIFKDGWGNYYASADYNRYNGQTIMDDTGACRYVMPAGEFNNLPFLTSSTSLQDGMYWLYFYEPDGSYADCFTHFVNERNAFSCSGEYRAGFRALPL